MYNKLKKKNKNFTRVLYETFEEALAVAICVAILVATHAIYTTCMWPLIIIILLLSINIQFVFVC